MRSFSINKNLIEKEILPKADTDVKDKEEIDELEGNMGSDFDKEGLMNSVLDNDDDSVDQGKLLEQALNQGMSSFTPDLMFEKMVENYSLAKQIYGEKLLQQATGHSTDYLEKNIKVPEFQRELKQKIQKSMNDLKKAKLIDKENTITNLGMELLTFTSYIKELDNLEPKGFQGAKHHKKASLYGEKQETRTLRKSDRYRDLALRQSIKTAIKRNHKTLKKEDLKVFERQAKGQSYIVYALDSSGSMKGNKLAACKKAGVALAYKALQEKDKVGLMIFGDEIKDFIKPTSDFRLLLKAIIKARASKETDLTATIKKSIELFPTTNVTKHLILITDAMPNIGDKPDEETLDAVGLAKANGITISLVGINLDEKGRNLGEQIINIGKGNFYVVPNVEEIDKIVLSDYYRST
jgi:Mg-chelatase subunit ChlD